MRLRKEPFFLSRLQKLWVLCIVLSTNSIHSQYTGVINSNRPGFSESPYSVGTGIYQLETSFFYRKSESYPIFSKPQSQGIYFLFRTSFFKEQLELNVNLSTQKDQISFENIFNSSYYTTGISKFTIAAKYLVYEPKYKDKSKEIRSWVKRNRFDWKRLIPSVAPYAGINTDMVNEIYKKGGISPKVGVLLQQEISNEFNIITNVYYDYIGTEIPEFSYIVTATFNFNDRWSTFFENQTRFDKYQNQNNIGTGIAFLFNRNLQINNSIRLLTDSKSTGFYSSIGISYRLNRHVDKVTNLDEKGNQTKNKGRFGGKKKGFFGRLFSKVPTIFKKKGKKQSRKSSNLKKESFQSINENSNEDENINNSSQGKQGKSIRVRPKRSRIKPSKIKIKKDKTQSEDIQSNENQSNESKKGLFGIFKKKSTRDQKKPEKEKDSEKGTKELERDIRKLERDIKKDEAKRKKENKRLEKKRKKEDATNKKNKRIKSKLNK